jgi:hypothetical protein
LGLVFHGIPEYRKSGLRVWGFTGLEDQLPSEVIQDRAKAVNYLTGDDSNDGRKRLDVGYVIEQLSRVRFVIRADGVGVAVEEQPDHRLQLLEVEFGPLNSVPNSKEIYGYGHSQ